MTKPISENLKPSLLAVLSREKPITAAAAGRAIGKQGTKGAHPVVEAALADLVREGKVLRVEVASKGRLHPLVKYALPEAETSLRLLVSVPVEDYGAEVDAVDALCFAIAGVSDGAGCGFNMRDLDWYLEPGDEDAAIALAERLAEALKGRDAQIRLTLETLDSDDSDDDEGEEGEDPETIWSND